MIFFFALLVVIECVKSLKSPITNTSSRCLAVADRSSNVNPGIGAFTAAFQPPSLKSVSHYELFLNCNKHEIWIFRLFSSPVVCGKPRCLIHVQFLDGCIIDLRGELNSKETSVKFVLNHFIILNYCILFIDVWLINIF